MNKINENYLKLVEDIILSSIHKYNYSPLNYSNKNLIKNLNFSMKNKKIKFK